MCLEFIRLTLHFLVPKVYFVPINYTVKQIMWAGPGGTAIPGQPVTEVEQAPITPSFSKNQFYILVLQCTTYQILS